MMTCGFRSFDEPWSAPQRRVWMALGAPEGPVGAEARGETRETADTSRVDTDPDGSDAAEAAQAAARELIARVQDPTHETYGQLNDRARQGLAATLTRMFDEKTDEYKTRVTQFQTQYAEVLMGNGQELARDLEAIVALAEGEAPVPAAPAADTAAPETQIPNYLLTVRPGDTMSAIIRNKLANNDMDPLRTQIARQYRLGDGFPTYAGGDTDGAQFMRLLMAKRDPDYYQNLIHPGNQVHFKNDGSITIMKGSARYAPGEKEGAAAPLTAEPSTSDAVAAAAPGEAAPAAPERSKEKIAALEKNWTEIIEPEIRKGDGKVSVTVSETQSSGPNNLEKTVTLINASGKTVELIIKPPTSPIEETYGIDASKQRFLVVDTEGKQTGYTSVFGSGNQLDFALNLLRTPDKPPVEAPAAPAAAPAEGPPVAEPPASDTAAAAAPAEVREAMAARIKEHLETAAGRNTPGGFKTSMEEISQRTFPDLLETMKVDLRKEIVTAVGMKFLDKDAIGGSQDIFMMSVDNKNPALGSFDLSYNASENKFYTRKVPLAEVRQARRNQRAEARQERRDQRYEELPLAEKLPIIERKGKVLVETIKSNLLQGQDQDARFELQKLYSLLKPLKGQHDEYNTMMSKWGFEFSTQDGAFILEVDKNNPNRRLIIESRMWSDGLYNIVATRR